VRVATNHRLLRASPERVFEVLMNTAAYGDWVVGSDAIRETDATWPAVGARFHHRVGVGPFKLNDHTEIVERVPQEKLVLHARARPMGTAVVTILLEPRDGGTLVTMRETAGDLLSHIGINPLTDWLVHLRNRESLRRLARIAETGAVKA
jgi:uncharacterized protein YndB with AHSA1/START domain